MLYVGVNKMKCKCSNCEKEVEINFVNHFSSPTFIFCEDCSKIEITDKIISKFKMEYPDVDYVYIRSIPETEEQADIIASPLTKEIGENNE